MFADRIVQIEIKGATVATWRVRSFRYKFTASLRLVAAKLLSSEFVLWRIHMQFTHRAIPRGLRFRNCRKNSEQRALLIHLLAYVDSFELAVFYALLRENSVRTC